jgi:hypothetical protein
MSTRFFIKSLIAVVCVGAGIAAVLHKEDIRQYIDEIREVTEL